MTFFPKSFTLNRGLLSVWTAKTLPFLAAILACPLLSRAAVLLNEQFNYPNGRLVVVSAGAWTTHSGVANQMEVLSGRADLSAPQTEDVNTLLAGQPYPATTGTVLYASFILNVYLLPSPSGEYFAHFKDTTTSNFRAKIYVLTSGAGVGKYRVGIANSANNASATNTTDLDPNTDYRIYLRYDISNASSTLWLNPTNEASPSMTASDVATARSVTSFALRQNTGIGFLQLDDLRIGTSFADVFVPPPQFPPVITQQPANAGAVVGGTAVFSVVATGDAPLSYQWKFGTTNLPAATNATLVLENATVAQAGQYSVTITNAAGSTNSSSATLTVFEPSASGTLSFVHYNVKGNFASDWSTNAPQVQAIARELLYLDPDVIALNEIPNGLRYEMTNWMIAFFPTRTLAVSPGTDGAIRSGVISRYPITRSNSWLLDASLTNFGYNGTFTRDLFEVQITVPGATEPLHVFTTHLKSGPDADSQDRRAAECSAVSNFFVTVFIPTNGWRPYVLVGDWNEDIAIPMTHSNQAIQRIVSTPTGLKLTTPLNPFTLGRFTHSIQGALDARFDYIAPAGVLASNIVSSQVFRTDLLPSPPPPLLTNDDVTASDHLPVQMIFNYPDPPLLTTLTVSNQTAVLRWPALVGRKFCVDSSANLTTWSLLASNLVATSNTYVFTTNASDNTRFFRVYRVQ